MGTRLKSGIWVMALSFLFLYSCLADALPAGLQPAVTEFPADVTMNKDAGRGGLLFVIIRLEDGEELPFVLDTGCPTTCFNQSLETKLGKRIRSETLWAFGTKSQINVYAAPRFYIGKTLLVKTGPFVVTHDCRQMSQSVGRPIMGILGMDILQHYCVQLDFNTGKVRFLDFEHANQSDWGRAFSLFSISDGCCCISANLTGTQDVYSLIDTGCNYDGWLTPHLFEQWTNQAAPPVPGVAHFPNGVLAGEIYSNLDLHGVDPKLYNSGDAHIKFNGVGLQFLSRNLVTLDFPEQTLYLKRTDISPTAHKDIKKEVKAAEKVIVDLQAKGQLPGWPKGDEITTNSVTFDFDFPDSILFNIIKKDDASSYHYKVSRSAEDSPWKLLKAWQTDSNGEVIKEFSVP
jgi:hypothetical protein